MSAPPQVALSGLARALVQHGRILEAEALACTSPSANPNDFLLELIKRGLMSAGDLARFAGQTFGSPIMDLAAYDVGHLPVDAIDRKLMIKHQVVALGRRGNRLTLALADPECALDLLTGDAARRVAAARRLLDVLHHQPASTTSLLPRQEER